MERLRFWLDMPPVWLLGFAFVAWVQGRYLPLGPGAMPLTDMAGGLLVGGGILLAAMAVDAMRRQQTTIVPHRDAASLVMSGIFKRSRNPIYLGDLMILTGLCLFWAAWPALLLVPLFAWLLTDRFIQPEEAQLSEKFGTAFSDYCRRTRRWI